MKKKSINYKKLYKRISKLNKPQKICLIVLVCIILLLIAAYCIVSYIKTGTFYPTPELLDGKPAMRFIDVGQGDSTLVTYKGDSVLIDAGPVSSGEVTAEYVRTYAPTLDYLIVTHPHEDHMGGVQYVLESVNVENLVINDVAVDEVFYTEALKNADKYGTNVIILDDGATFDAGEIHITIIDTFDLEYDDLNDSSMITRVDVGDTSILFSGDAERHEEKYALFVEETLLDCDILHVGHHGSKSSTCQEFLEAVSPEICVISCGRDNSYGHPTREVLDRIRAYGAEIYRTDRSGTVVLFGE